MMNTLPLKKHRSASEARMTLAVGVKEGRVTLAVGVKEGRITLAVGVNKGGWKLRYLRQLSRISSKCFYISLCTFAQSLFHRHQGLKYWPNLSFLAPCSNMEVLLPIPPWRPSSYGCRLLHCLICRTVQ
jgi:hypothetical protein